MLRAWSACTTVVTQVCLLQSQAVRQWRGLWVNYISVNLFPVAVIKCSGRSNFWEGGLTLAHRLVVLPMMARKDGGGSLRHLVILLQPPGSKKQLMLLITSLSPFYPVRDLSLCLSPTGFYVLSSGQSILTITLCLFLKILFLLAAGTFKNKVCHRWNRVETDVSDLSLVEKLCMSTFS